MLLYVLLKLEIVSRMPLSALRAASENAEKSSPSRPSPLTFGQATRESKNSGLEWPLMVELKTAGLMRSENR